jgi:hypothetical protein
MKKLIGLLVAFTLSLGAFAQIATVKGDAEMMKRAIAEGVFEFTLPEDVEKEQVEKSANYYTDYFTVEYNHDSRLAKIVMIDNDAMTRRIITRFLLSNKIKLVSFDGNNYTINEFYEKYMIQ